MSIIQWPLVGLAEMWKDEWRGLDKQLVCYVLPDAIKLIKGRAAACVKLRPGDDAIEGKMRAQLVAKEREGLAHKPNCIHSFNLSDDYVACSECNECLARPEKNCVGMGGTKGTSPLLARLELELWRVREWKRQWQRTKNTYLLSLA